jgi:DNA-binding MarR family transcriptional regulator
MSLADELGFPNPRIHTEHEALLNVVLTGALLAKEGDRLLRPFGLTDSQFNVLMLLKHQNPDDGHDQTRLGEMLLVNRSNVTGLIDRMERAGWVTRTDDPSDRRVKRVRLTDAGHTVLRRAEKVYRGRLREVMGILKESENKDLCRMLERVRRQLRGGQET